MHMFNKSLGPKLAVSCVINDWLQEILEAALAAQWAQNPNTIF